MFHLVKISISACFNHIAMQSFFESLWSLLPIPAFLFLFFSFSLIMMEKDGYRLTAC